MAGIAKNDTAAERGVVPKRNTCLHFVGNHESWKSESIKLEINKANACVATVALCVFGEGATGPATCEDSEPWPQAPSMLRMSAWLLLLVLMFS